MKRIDTFLHADITFVQYLQKVLEDQSIDSTFAVVRASP